MTNTTYRRAIDLLEADLNDELVALDPKEGNCFGFNSVATSVWRQLATPCSFDDLKNALLREYDVSEETCRVDLEELLIELQAKGLVRKSETR